MKELWEKTIEFHGHTCPGIAMGFKICEGVIKKMGINPQVDELICVSENNTCPADAVRFILNCTEENNRLDYRPSDDLAFSFFNKSNGEKLKVKLNKINKDPNMTKDEFINYILDADIDDILVFSEPTCEF